MKNCIIAFVFLLLSNLLIANDGVYLNIGGQIYPTQETKISLEKELLSFKVRDKVATVDIQFIFHNPENTARKVLLGFQAPTSGGDVSDVISNLNQITHFTIVKDQQILPYELKAAECEDCMLKDPKEFHFSQSETGIFVYLFEVTFQPGINQLQHSYRFPVSHNVAFDQIYSYILTTGAKWANGTIKDLIVSIDMGENQYFYVQDIFGATSKWSIIGTGKVTNQSFAYDEFESKMVRVLSGSLQIAVKDFHPSTNIEFGLVHEDSFTPFPIHIQGIRSGETVIIGDYRLSDDYSNAELRLLRNTIYAQYGYVFQSQDLKDYFSKFAWYMPNPNLKLEDIQLTEREKKYIEAIQTKEMRE